MLLLTMIHRDLNNLLCSLPLYCYYDLYRFGGRLYLDTGSGQISFTFSEKDEVLIERESVTGRWIFAKLDVDTCDPRLTFPFDYFEECMADECKWLRQQLRESAEKCVEDLFFRAGLT